MDDFAPSTRRILEAAWRTFERWADLQDVPALPADSGTVFRFLDVEAYRLTPYTLGKVVRAVQLKHLEAGYPDPTEDPTVANMLDVVRNDRALRDLMETKVPVVVVGDPRPSRELMLMVEALPTDDLLGVRDRALLLTGGAARLSKAALVTVRVEDISASKEAIDIAAEHRGARRIYRLKRELGAPGVDKAIEAWTDAAGFTAGPVFRSVDRWGNVGDSAMTPEAVGKVLKRAATQAGLPQRFGRASALSHR